MAARAIRINLLAALAGMMLIPGCIHVPTTAPPMSEPLAALPLSPARPPSLIVTTVPEAPEDAAPTRSVTLTAANVDVRALLPALAEAAEVSLVMGPQVQGRVTVNFVDVPADEAIRLVLAEAGLMIEQPPVRSPWAPVVFYALPINVDTAEPDLMRARYHITAEMAQWLVDTRIR
jgi:hypothetical protein